MTIKVIDENIGLLYHAATKSVVLGRISKQDRNDFINDLYIELAETLSDYNPEYALSTWIHVVARRVQQRMVNARGARRVEGGKRESCERNFDSETTLFWQSREGRDERLEHYEMLDEVSGRLRQLMNFIDKTTTSGYQKEDLKKYIKIYLMGNCKTKSLRNEFGLSSSRAKRIADYLDKILIEYRAVIDD